MIRRLSRMPLGLSIIAAACAPVGPDYTRPDIALPAAFPGATPTTIAVPIDAQWWRLFGDAALDKLVASALERNADVRMAVARIEESEANLREAGAALLPELDAGATPSRSRISTILATPVPGGIPPVRNDLRVALSTAYEIDFWGRLRRGVEAARAQALASRYAKDVVSLSLAGLTAQGYFSLRSLDAQIAATRASLASRDETLDMVRRRARGGIASGLDVNQAEAARADAASQLKDLQRQRALAEHLLATLAGRLDFSLPQSADTLLALPPPPVPPAGLPSSLLERRPDVRQAEQVLVASNAQIGVARAAMLPTISLTSFAGGESQSLADLTQSGGRIWSLGFGLTLPVFDWGRLAARTDAAQARAQQSLAAYQKAVESAFREVADALSSVEQATASEEDLRARAVAARNALRLARLRYESGYSPYLEVLDAQRTANDAEIAFLRNRQNRLAASVDLMKALGGGWAPAQ